MTTNAENDTTSGNIQAPTGRTIKRIASQRNHANNSPQNEERCCCPGAFTAVVNCPVHQRLCVGQHHRRYEYESAIFAIRSPVIGATAVSREFPRLQLSAVRGRDAPGKPPFGRSTDSAQSENRQICNAQLRGS